MPNASIAQPFSVNTTSMQHFEDGTLIGLPPELDDTEINTNITKVCKVTTKLVSGTQIDIANAIKELILLDTVANGSFSCNLR